MSEILIEVSLKKGVADPEGDATLKALRLLGFDAVSSVGTAKRFRIRMDVEAEEAKTAAEEMCRKLLANPVIHEYTVTVE